MEVGVGQFCERLYHYQTNQVRQSFENLKKEQIFKFLDRQN